MEENNIELTENTANEESMKDYEREIGNSFRTINEGDILTGTVIDVTDEEVTVDLNYYTQGIIKADELSDDPGYAMLEEIRIGDPITAEVLKVDDGYGNILLSKKSATKVLVWDVLREYKDTRKVCEVKVSQAVNAGAVAYIEGIRGFIPASQLDLSYVEDTSAFVGKKLRVIVTEVNANNEKVILSAKEVLRDEMKEEQAHKIAMIVPGTIVEGCVESLQNYGAFIDLGGGLSGLCHISQISEFRISRPSEVLKVGDKVKVKILNTNDGKISLSIKEAAVTSEEENSAIVKDAAEFLDSSDMGTSLGDLLKGFKFD